MRANREKGRDYEDRAVCYLEQEGWTIIQRNYHSSHGEIDCIAVRNSELAFVEVKGRRKKTSFLEDAVNRGKQEKIRKTAEQFLQESETEYTRIQMAVLWIEEGQISFIENAFDCD